MVQRSQFTPCTSPSKKQTRPPPPPVSKYLDHNSIFSQLHKTDKQNYCFRPYSSRYFSHEACKVENILSINYKNHLKLLLLVGDNVPCFLHPLLQQPFLLLPLGRLLRRPLAVQAVVMLWDSCQQLPRGSRRVHQPVNFLRHFSSRHLQFGLFDFGLASLFCQKLHFFLLLKI